LGVAPVAPQQQGVGNLTQAKDQDHQKGYQYRGPQVRIHHIGKANQSNVDGYQKEGCRAMAQAQIQQFVVNVVAIGVKG
jgi:hypothetical protein